MEKEHWWAIYSPHSMSWVICVSENQHSDTGKQYTLCDSEKEANEFVEEMNQLN